MVLSITLMELRYTKINLCSANSQNLVILSNLEILGRTSPREEALLITLDNGWQKLFRVQLYENNAPRMKKIFEKSFEYR